MDVDMNKENNEPWPGQYIHQATIYDNDELLDCLLQGDERKHINAVDVCGRSAVYTAVSNGSLKCLLRLLENGADPNIPAGSRFGFMTPLHEAVLNSKLNAMYYLLRHGADPTMVDISGKTPLALAKHMQIKDAVRLLETDAVAAQERMDSLSRRLCEACAGGNIEQVEAVLCKSGRLGRDVINTTTKGLSPLAIAAKCGFVDILSLLLSEGPQCSIQKDTGFALLHLACESGATAAVELLLQNFPEMVAVRSVDHQVPLHLAVISQQVEVVKCLLDFTFPKPHLVTFTDKISGITYSSGIDFNAQDCAGETPLHIACRNGFLDIATVLASHSITIEVEKSIPRSTSLRSRTFELERDDTDDSSVEDTDNMPSKLPESHSTLKISRSKQFQIVYPADIHHQTYLGLSPLQLAINHQYEDIVKALLESRPLPLASVSVYEKQASLLFYAFEHGTLAILNQLLCHGLVDVDNKVLSAAIISQDRKAVHLMLTHKTIKDQTYSINKSEMKKAAYLASQVAENNQESMNSLDSDHRAKYPNTAIAVTWDSTGMLETVPKESLLDACFLHNPTLAPSVNSSVALCAITRVDLSKNSFRAFPTSILQLPSLVKLNLTRNQISMIPEEASLLCYSLEELHLKENRLESLPKFIFLLRGLKFLDASVNRIADLPAEMWASPSLISLNLSNNCLTWLPASPRHTPMHRNSTTSSLIRYGNGGSFRQDVAASFTGSVGSADFDLEYGDMGGDDLSDFTMLSMQNLTNNHLRRVNKWTSDLTVVDRDPWKGSGKPSGLKQLWLNHNKFSTVPPCLACCAPCLEILEMAENQLTSVGNLNDYPSALVTLDLSKNCLKSVASWCVVADPSNQDSLCLGHYRSTSQAKFSISSGNPSRSPASMSNASPTPSRDSLIPTCPHRCHLNLAKLEKLNLSFNKLSAMCLVRSSDNSEQTDTYSVCSMESEEIQGRLLFPRLSELNLTSNMLTSLPPEIGEQGALKILSLRRNLKLRELHPKLGLLKNLWKLDLENCPLDGAIQDFLQNSRFPVKDILGFLQSVLEESTEYNCMNLMLVGFHEIGKTSLLQKLNERGKPKSKSSHWKDRMNQSGGRKSTTQLSTVGIDINELVLEKRSNGPVILRTWDFGGQREYYATHQYFLSPRSLYLVVWSIIDGERGVESLLQWLINIQARAPGAPVIIVGTHLDILHDKATRRNYPEDFEESMTKMIHKMFLSNQEPDKSGLPHVLETINVSCKTGENVKKLADFIYEQAFLLKHPRSRTQNLIGQKIPRKYLLLQGIVRQLAAERASSGKEPVLNRSKYTLCVQNKMMEKGVTFRDVEELEQATRFLHENGVLFHYDDLPLRDFFFLDPQWLCDQLARVITVKEINNFVQRGVMRVSSLEFLFKSQMVQPENIALYITNLLSKFEVALQFDEEHLLLPSLLPTETELQEMVRKKSDVRIPLRRPKEASAMCGDRPSSPDKRYELVRSRKSGRRLIEGPPSTLHVGSSIFYAGSQIGRETQSWNSVKDNGKLKLLTIKPTSNAIFSRCRLYFMTYFPSGFWPRLITRILADDSLFSIVCSLFEMPGELQSRSPEVNTLVERDPEWRCWQTGLELFYLGFEMLRIREVFFSTSSYFCNYSQCKVKCSIESEWSYLDVHNSKILEITFPTDSLCFFVTNSTAPLVQNLRNSNQSTTVYRNEVATAQLMVKVVEHIDNLLQDWYPDLGEQRFSQNCYGRYLVTRVIPCPQCLHREVSNQRRSKNNEQSWFLLNPDVPDMCMPVELNDTPDQSKQRNATVKDQSASLDDSESEYAQHTRPRTLTEGQALIYHKASPDSETIIFSWLVERCMLEAMRDVNIICPMHGPVSPAYLIDDKGSSQLFSIAPDVAFQDLSLSFLMPPCGRLDIGECIGGGNFGKVHEGLYFFEDSREPEQVAVKILSKGSWDKKELSRGLENYVEQACIAYLTARQEVSILSRLDHPNIVPLLGLCPQPLSLILWLAPLGALDTRLKQLNNDGDYLPFFVIRQIIIQVAGALSYLHANNIIYRDLKSENVLIWELPNPGEYHPTDSVDVKIADYGISRTVLPSGARGFGGTLPFIAPEILQHAGKGIYTEKVDTFSFGMFLFELLTCRAPFAGINNPVNLICEGQRPSLTVQEVERYPSYALDLMAMCWSEEQDQRPSMDAIQNITGCQQFCHLQDVLSLGPDLPIYHGCSVSFQSTGSGSVFSDDISGTVQSSELQQSQVWLSSGCGGHNAIEILSFNSCNRVDNHKTFSLPGAPVIAMCVYNDIVWCADEEGYLQLFHCDTLQSIYKKQLPVKNGLTCTVLNLHPLVEERRVLAVAREGLIFECQAPGVVPYMEDSVVAIHAIDPCFCSILVDSSNGCEVWLGQKKGAMTVWSYSSHTTICCLSHGTRIAQSSSTCFFLISQTGAVKDSYYVWSYNYPGSIICLWNSSRRSLMGKLDCSQIVSTVDSPVLATAEQFECGQVSALSAIDHYLYIGTTRGCVLVTEAISLVPLCLFQCHSDRDFFIKAILPVLPPAQEEDVGTYEELDESSGVNPLRCPAVVTVGMGYHNILKTFHPNMDNIPGMQLDSNSPRPNPHLNHTFLLSWSASNWEFY